MLKATPEALKIKANILIDEKQKKMFVRLEVAFRDNVLPKK